MQKLGKITTALVGALFLFFIASASATAQEADITSVSASPDPFSPNSDGNYDTTTITVNGTASQTLYLNVYDNTLSLVRYGISLSASDTTYTGTWDGKNQTGSALSDGNYTIKVSTDNTGNSIYENKTYAMSVEIETVAPTLTAVSINSDAAYATTANVTLTITSSGATQMIVSNNANFTGASWETIAGTKAWTLNTTTDGTKTVYVKVRDAARNTVQGNDSITYDSTAPTASLSIASGADQTNSTSVALTLSASDANTVTEMRFRNGTEDWTAWESYATAKAWVLNSTEGLKTVSLSVKDSAGNTKTVSDTITLDTTAPSNLSISINSGATYTNVENVTLTLSASGGPATMYLSNNGSVWTSYTYATSKTWTLNSTTDGTKTVYFKVADTAGNNATAVSASITLDTIGPSQPNLTSPTNGQTVSTQTPTFTWTNSSDVVRAHIRILDSSLSLVQENSTITTTSYTASTLAIGTYYWKVEVFDAAGNSVNSTQKTFTISTTGLAIPTPTSPGDGEVSNSTSLILRWTTVTNATFYDVRYNTTSNLTGTTAIGVSVAQYTVTNLTDGTYYWQVRARNTSTQTNYSAVRSFIIDQQPPQGLSISINSGANTTASTTVTLTLAATGATQMAFSNDNASWSTWEAFATTKQWSMATGDGTKTVYVKVKDAAGNQVQSSDTITLDATAPVISGNSPTGTISSTTPTIHVSLTDAGVGVDTARTVFVFDGVNHTANATVATGSIDYTTAALSDGAYVVNVTVADALGTTAYLQWSFTVSTSSGGGTPPPTDNYPVISAVTHAPSSVTSTDQVTVTATITDDAGISSATLYWNVGGGALQSSAMAVQSGTTYAATMGPFDEGAAVSYYLRAIDTASQVTTSATGTFTVADATAPTISNLVPANGATTSDTMPAISASYSDATGIATTSVVLLVDSNDVTASATVTTTGITYTPSSNLAAGVHSVQLTVADTLGNAATQSWSFTVAPTADVAAPVISGIMPQDGSSSTNTRPAITAAYTDASNIDTASVVLKINGVDVTTSAVVGASSVTYTPATGLTYGTHTAELTVADALGNAATATWTFTIDATETKVPVGTITPGSVVVSLGDYGIALTEITIVASTGAVNVSVTVEELSVKPETIEAPDGTVYNYQSIEWSNISDASISSATVTFKVDKGWVSANTIDTATIQLLRYVEAESAWQAYDATLVSQDDDMLYFEATVEGFSVFAVAGSAEAAPAEDSSMLFIVAIAAALVIGGIIAVMVIRRQ